MTDLEKRQYLEENGWLLESLEYYHDNSLITIEGSWYCERYHKHCLNKGMPIERGYENDITWFMCSLEEAYRLTLHWNLENDLDTLINS